MKNWMTYEKIQELKRNHLNKSQVSRRLQIDYKTVAKYWDMPPDEFSTCRNRTQRRRRKADVYKDFILNLSAEIAGVPVGSNKLVMTP